LLRIIIICAITQLFLASLVKGGVVQWASLSWVMLSAVILTTFIATQNKENVFIYKIKFHNLFSNPSILFFLAFQFWAVLQIISPIHYNSYSGTEFALLGWGMFVFLLLLLIGLQDLKNLRLLYIGIILLILFQAVYGLAIYLSQINKLLWMDKVFYLDRPTGTLVNPNHFAALLSLGIILLACYICSTLKLNKRKPVTLTALDLLFNPYLIITFFLFFTLLMTKSIGAILALCCVLLIAGIKEIYNSNSRKKILFFTSFTSIAVIAFLLIADYSIIAKELSGLSHTFSRRLALSQASWVMALDHWLVGVGGGAFYSTFSPYRTLDIGNTYYNFAHNDYLQFWIEYGIIGILFLFGFILSAIKENVITLKKSNDPLRRTFAYTSIYSSIGLAIHSLVDFPLHIFIYCLTFLCIISVNVIINTLEKLKLQDNQVTHHN